MNDLNKKWLTIAAGLAISGGLMVLITNELRPTPQEDIPISNEQTDDTPLILTESEFELKSAETENAIKVPSILDEETQKNEDISQWDTTHIDPNVTIPAPDTMNGVDTGTEQTIQPDVAEKPTYTDEQLQDPSQTPDGGKVTVSESGEITQETTKIPSTTATSGTTTTQTPTNSSGTSTQTNQNGAYVPGFGYVPYNDAPNVATQATDMYENGNKVGSM